MEWKSIKEQLPPKDELILIYADEEIKIGTYDGGEPEDKYSWMTYCGCSHPTSSAKHWISLPNQPERSKREDSQGCEMRCSEHCGNTVRDK